VLPNTTTTFGTTTTTTSTTTTTTCAGQGQGPCDSVPCCSGLVCEVGPETCQACLADGALGCVANSSDCCAGTKCYGFGDLCSPPGITPGVCLTCLPDSLVNNCVLYVGCTSDADCCNPASACVMAWHPAGCGGSGVTICVPNGCLATGTPCGCSGDCCSGVCSGGSCQ
jgi:hypothetical protein